MPPPSSKTPAQEKTATPISPSLSPPPSPPPVNAITPSKSATASSNGNPTMAPPTPPSAACSFSRAMPPKPSPHSRPPPACSPIPPRSTSPSPRPSPTPAEKPKPSKTLDRAASLDPKNPEAHLLLAIASQDAGDIPAAERAFCAAISLDPRNPAPFRLLGRLLESTNRRAQAIDCFQAQILLEPAAAEPHHRIAESRRALGQPLSALESYDQALRREPAHILAHGGRALALLALGRFSEGWTEYEWRWQAPNFPMKKPHFTFPEWTGQPLEGKSLLVYAEQGIGDTLMLARFLPLLADRGAKIFLQIPAPLIELLRTLKGIEKILPDTASAPAADFHISTFSLPRLFATTLETIPANVPYLSADPEKIASFTAQFAPLPHPRIGLCWAGNPRFFRDVRRSIPLSACSPLFEIPNISWISLVKEIPSADRAALQKTPQLLDLSRQFTDFSQTAAAISHLDLILTVDTAVAHLASAMAKPTWLLLPDVAEWRWLENRPDSPWYPTMRLFRQPKPHDWPALISTIAAELRHSPTPIR